MAVKYTIEEIKKELNSYTDDKKYLEDRKQDVEELREQATKMTSVISDMPKGSNPVNDRLAEYVAKITDMVEESYKFVIELEEKRIRIENIINQIEQPYKNILYYRYIKDYNLTDVASQIGHEYKWTCVLHGKALEKYRKIREVEK